MSIFKRTQRKYVKKAYRVRNWREYEAGLRNRGSLTVWISLTAGKLVNWDAPRPRKRKPDRQRKYSNHAIETAVTLGMVFHLSSRQSEGLLRSLFVLLKLDNDVPDHTTISRRKAKLGKVPFYQDKQKTPLHILIDSSGLAVHAGQLRRAPKSRDYRKLHLCVDEQSGEVVAGELTSKRARDSSRVASLVGQSDSPISSARADTAYDAGGVYEAIENHSAHRSPRVLIPPRKGAQLASGPASSCLGAQLAISVHNCPVLADSRFPMSIFKRTQRKYVKKAYRVRNWREYEAGLRNRGSLTVWISLTAGKLVNWDAPRPRRRNPGRQRKYSNHAIETAVTLGMVFHLSSRQSEGLLRSLFVLLKLDNDVPDHTTISRRKAKLGKVPFYQDKQKTPLHILFDSSGLAVHAGQLRRAPNSRDYRKLHLCVDEQSGEVIACELTSKRARDSSRVASLVGQIDSPISSARADTAYDASGVYEAIENHSAHRSPRVLIPPRKGALLASGPASSRQRNRNIAAQARLGKRKWHTESGYSKRSKVETTFHRYKAIVGSAMRARGLAAQRVEARIGCKILNTVTALGMPDSEMIG